jgi:hypothetical protein
VGIKAVVLFDPQIIPGLTLPNKLAFSSPETETVLKAANQVGLGIVYCSLEPTAVESTVGEAWRQCFVRTSNTAEGTWH